MRCGTTSISTSACPGTRHVELKTLRPGIGLARSETDWIRREASFRNGPFPTRMAV